MEAVFAAVSVYLAIAWRTAQDFAVEEPSSGIVAQARIAVAVLLAGLMWPHDYWRILRRDWDNYFVD